MAEATLAQVEELVAQLAPQDQLKLVARIGERLSSTLTVPHKEESEVERAQEERLRLAEALLAEVEEIEDDSQGTFDAAEDIRRMREERATQICRKDA